MDNNNIYQGQIQGPFQANQELMGLIRQQSVKTVSYIKHLGIQTPTDNVVIHPSALVELIINGKKTTIEVGKTNIYEIGNTEITSIKFLEDKDNNTIIDYTAIVNAKEEEHDRESVM